MGGTWKHACRFVYGTCYNQLSQFDWTWYESLFMKLMTWLWSVEADPYIFVLGGCYSITLLIHDIFFLASHSLIPLPPLKYFSNEKSPSSHQTSTTPSFLNSLHECFTAFSLTPYPPLFIHTFNNALVVRGWSWQLWNTASFPVYVCMYQLTPLSCCFRQVSLDIWEVCVVWLVKYGG